jgi:DNA replicative helicase MCM subunit Mcm2 (Cdc46/Mcm family)
MKLQRLKVVSWDYAIEQAMKITNDRPKAESYLKQLRNSSQIIQDPEGYWRTIH